MGDKVIVKTAVKTIVSLFVIFIIIFAILNFAFPSTMATLFENSGNYSVAVRYAQLEYNYSGEVEALSRVVEDAVYADRDDVVAEYGDMLIKRGDFAELCEKKDAHYSGQYPAYSYSYMQYIYGRISVAYYVEKDDYDTAVARAEEGRGRDSRGSFATANAYVSLAVAIAEKGDSSNAKALCQTLEKLNVSEDEEEYLKGLIAVLNNVQ